MDLGLADKVAFVAAGSQGLGHAAALELAREGAKVAICGRNDATLQQTAAAIQAETNSEVLAVVADVTDPAAIQNAIAQTIAHFGGLHILVTNAGGPPPGYFDNLDDAAWEQGWNLSFMSVVRLIRAALPHLKTAGWGRIITITSATVKQPMDDLLISSAIRPGVVGLVRSLATQLGPSGITVNNLAPGFTLTERVSEIFAARSASKGTSFEQEAAGITNNTPVGRMGQPAEIGALIAFIASTRAGYITGQTFLIDGGAYRGLA
ncbi:SDR family oxidoreductase [Herpetosiphon sp. NSE202]|uniref:SDR family oxidoreductase n=1 Tax=Herpetosiphon sp. NSE202 TaxID=3351349 RepID=UPI00363283DB